MTASDVKATQLKWQGSALKVSDESVRLRRILAGVVGFACAIVLGVAAWLTPSPTGMGTHEQIGLAPCGWILMMDLPCPTCGMTTAFAHAAEGQFGRSFVAQPLGFLLTLATAMTFLVCLYTVLTGSRLPRIFRRLWGVSTGWLLVAMILAAWLFKIASHKGWV